MGFIHDYYFWLAITILVLVGLRDSIRWYFPPLHVRVQRKSDLYKGTEYSEIALQNMLCQIISEEAAEITQVASKMARFGPDDPKPQNGKTNWENLIHEFNDLVATIEMLQESCGYDGKLMDRSKIKAKKERVLKYLQISRDLGRLP